MKCMMSFSFPLLSVKPLCITLCNLFTALLYIIHTNLFSSFLLYVIYEAQFR